MAIGTRIFHARNHENNFVGREDEQNLFRIQCQNLLTQNKICLINYYGVGGIGKTALLKKLMRELDDWKKVSAQYKKICVLYHDFANGIDMREILQMWKSVLEKFGCEFPYFDLGNFYLFVKEGNTNVTAPAMKSWIEKSTLFNRAKNSLNKVTNFSNAAIPGANAVATIAEVTSDALGIIPGIATINAIGKIFNDYLVAKKTKEQLERNAEIKNELERRNKLRNPDELKNYLPTLFAQDIYDWSNEDKKFVIFLDSCEILTGGKKLADNNLPHDWWICGNKNSYGLISMLNDTLWVTVGRNKLSWSNAEIISRHIGTLNYADSRKFLESTKVNKIFYDKIIKISDGYPIFLKGLAEYNSDLNKVPLEKLAAEIREEIIKRINRDLNANEKTMLEKLCALEKWTDEVVKEEHFNPHTYRKLKEMSFIQSADENFFILEPTLQKILWR